MISPAPKKTTVIGVGNQKGGVGKTTTCLNIAAALGEMGRKVLVWDLDGNAGATKMLGVPDTFLGSYEVLMGQERPQSVILSSSEEFEFPTNVSLLPARRNLENLDAAIRGQNLHSTGSYALVRPLEELVGEYDYIFLDTAPSRYAPTQAAYGAAEFFLLAAIPDALAIEGLDEAISDLAATREMRVNQDLKLLGVVLGGLDLRTNLSRALRDYVDEKFTEGGGGAFEAKPRNAVAVPTAVAQGKIVFQTDPGHPVVDDFRLLAREMEARIKLLRSPAKEEVVETPETPERTTEDQVASNG